MGLFCQMFIFSNSKGIVFPDWSQRLDLLFAKETALDPTWLFKLYASQAFRPQSRLVFFIMNWKLRISYLMFYKSRNALGPVCVCACFLGSWFLVFIQHWLATYYLVQKFIRNSARILFILPMSS